MDTRTIVVEDYNHQWVPWFTQLAARIGDVVGDLALSIEHVGSTSVPGLAAKPIIDIDIVILLRDFDEVTERLQSLGYKHVGDQGISTREVFKILDDELRASLPRHHLYVCDNTSLELKQHLVFRDYLRDHADLAREYGELKKMNAKKYPHDIDAYLDGKEAFVQKIIKKAIKEGYGTYEYLDPEER